MKKSPARRVPVIVVAALATAVILGVVGCSSVVKTSTPAHTARAAAKGSEAAPSPTPSLSGPVGTSYTVTGPNGNKISVTLARVIDPAAGADQITTPQSGSRFAGAVFTIKGISGTFSDDANNNATIIGSNGQTYTADLDSIAGYTDFNDGEYSVSAGESLVGAVTFQIPLAVAVSKVEWSANGSFGGAPAEWLISARASTAGSPAASGDPWSVVSAYYQDITLRDYAAAWKLLDPTLQSGGYTKFAAGYADTGKQTVTKTSQSGDQVSFTLQSDNPDGTVQTYQGTDTVTSGKIVAAHIVQTS